jgi:hypothetical protein
MVEIKSYPAKSGDAFLVKSTDRPFSMLIDGGYAETFQQHIKPDLVNLAASGYELDVVVATPTIFRTLVVLAPEWSGRNTGHHRAGSAS